MFKFSFLAFISTLISFSAFSSIVGEGGDGAGGAGGDGAGDNGEAGAGDDGAGDNGEAGAGDDGAGDDGAGAGGEAGAGEDNTTLSSEEQIALRTIIEQNEERELISNVETDIITRIPEFKAQSVVDGLRELHKTDPTKAEFYNASPAGWEMYHRDHLSNLASGDDINSGSHSGSGGNFDDSLAKARSGDKKSVKSVLDGSRA